MSLTKSGLTGPRENEDLLLPYKSRPQQSVSDIEGKPWDRKVLPDWETYDLISQCLDAASKQLLAAMVILRANPDLGSFPDTWEEAQKDLAYLVDSVEQFEEIHLIMFEPASDEAGPTAED